MDRCWKPTITPTKNPSMSPKLTLLDLLIGAGFFTVVIGLGMWKSRRARDHAEDTADFFLGGRSLAWPLIGISIVAANISTEQFVGMAGQGGGWRRGPGGQRLAVAGLGRNSVDCFYAAAEVSAGRDLYDAGVSRVSL